MKYFSFYCAALIVITQLLSCKKVDEATTLKAYLINQSHQEVTVLSYKNGVVLPDDTIRISHGDTFLYGNSWRFGDSKGPGFGSDYAGGLDDHKEVLFNDEYKVFHYLNVVGDTTVPHYLITDDRNIMNPDNYDFEMIRTKRESINNHYYTFTEADYEFSKK